MNLFNTLLKSILFFSTLIPALTLADNTLLPSTNRQYSIGLDFGVARPTNIANSSTFKSGYSTFSYGSNTNSIYASISGISVNKILTIAPLYSLQAGVSFHHISSMDVNGNFEQGISPPYYQSTYSYSVNSSQYLIDAKLRRQFCNLLFPYLYLGLGIASNRAFDYSASVPDYLVVTPLYKDKTTNSFTYSVGLGVDYFVKSNVSLGVGYRFINLGKLGLGTGAIRNTTVGTKLTQSNLYINTLLAQLNYFI